MSRNTAQRELLYTQVFRTWARPLYFYIRRYVVSHEDSEDILQETLLRAYRSIDSLKDPAAAKCWIYRIATNEVSRFLGKKYHRGLFEVSGIPPAADGEEEVPPPELYEGPYIDYGKVADIELGKAVLSLPGIQRTVFNLRYWEEMSYEEISAVTGSSVGSLKVSYHKAKERITQMIGRTIYGE